MLTGRPFPAMVAPIVDLAGEVISAHLTFLKPDGSGQAYQKPAKGEPDRRRQCHSSFKGGTIRLMPADPDRELALAEGIEKALAASELFNVPAWSAVNAGGFKTADIPPEHRRLLIIADNDASGCSQRNAIAGAERWEAERRSVRIWVPPTVGHDASDVLKNRVCND
jgi:putative DNA primase/helicase